MTHARFAISRIEIHRNANVVLRLPTLDAIRTFAGQIPNCSNRVNSCVDWSMGAKTMACPDWAPNLDVSRLSNYRWIEPETFLNAEIPGRVPPYRHAAPRHRADMNCSSAE